MAATRILAGGAILLFIGLLCRYRMQVSRAEWGWLSLSAVLMWNGGNGMVTWAEQHAHSGYAALVVGTTPMFSALVESAFNRRRPSSGLVLSLLVGFAGLFLLTWPVLHRGTHGDLGATLALVAAPFCWSLGSTIQQRHPLRLPVVVSAGWQQVVGALGFLVLVVLTGEPRPHPGPGGVVGLGLSGPLRLRAFLHRLRGGAAPIAHAGGHDLRLRESCHRRPAGLVLPARNRDHHHPGRHGPHPGRCGRRVPAEGWINQPFISACIGTGIQLVADAHFD
jgi:hypothetical protein